MSKYKEWCNNYVNRFIDNYPLLIDYQKQIEDFIVFHLVSIGVRYKDFGKKNFERYINDRDTEGNFDYHTARHQFFNLSKKTKALKEDREKRKVYKKSETNDIFNFWDELDILLISKGDVGKETEKPLRTTLGRFSRSNLKAITYDNYLFFDESYREKIENAFAGTLDELEMPLHLYMFERGIRFHMLKLFCKMLDDYNKNHSLPKTPQKEHTLTYLETLKIPSLSIVKRFINSKNFNPSDFQYAKGFQQQLNTFLFFCLSEAFKFLNYLYDTQLKYYIKTMRDSGYYYSLKAMSKDELKELGVANEVFDTTNPQISEKKMNFYSFARAITEEEDIQIFYKEADEDNYLNEYRPRGNHKDFSINTFNKLKMHLTSIIKENDSYNRIQ